MKNFYIIGLGCKRRKIDDQTAYNYLIANGFSYAKTLKNADLVIISTCANDQRQEDRSVEAIEHFSRLHKKARFVITGCLPKINPPAIKKLGSFTMIGPTEMHKFDDLINAKFKFNDFHDANLLKDFPIFTWKSLPRRFIYNLKIDRKFAKKCFIFAQRLLLDLVYKFKRSHRSDPDFKYKNNELFFLRLAKGCPGNCSYCAIKFATGRLRSKPIDEIINEFRSGLDKGHKLFLLTAGDTGAYGQDINTNVVELFKEIFKFEGDYRLIIKSFNIQWLIRYHSELLPLFRDNFHKIDYITLPVQSASDNILEKMRRPYKTKDMKKVFRNVMDQIPELKITTHILVGFPGETQDDFMRTVEFIEEFKLYYVNCFGYQDRPGTEASRSKSKIPEAIIEKRLSHLRKVLSQQNIRGY